MKQQHCQCPDLHLFLSAWNKSQNLNTPDMHFQIVTWLQKCWELGKTRLILQAFRASGKSTLIAIFSAWLLCRDPDLRILVLSAESILAEKMVRMIRKVIEHHPMTTGLRPDRADQWAADSFTIKRTRISRDPSVLARGLHANITGTRADVILCDDVEVPNTCDTAEKREKLRERLGENDFILTPGGTVLYIGTPHSYYTIYAGKPRTEIGEEEIFLRNYERAFVPIVNEKGGSAWPERYSMAAIDEMRVQTGPMKFAAQMMLEPVNILNSKLDPSLLIRYDEEIIYSEAQQTIRLFLCGNKLASVSAWWDPAFGTGHGDASVLAVVYTDTEGKYWLHRVEYITVKAGEGEDEASLQCRRVAEIAKALFIPVITVETNGIGKFLPNILRRTFGEMGVNCGVIEKASGKAKVERILEAFDARLAARSLNVHKSVYETPFIREMTEWKPKGGAQRDDGLDAVAGAILNEPIRVQRPSASAPRIWYAGGETHAADTQFDV
ncbi:MAG: hypothetical protein DI626_01965 [Micavibrio aeruginosavorus]|uniref:Terminase large subunit gp17-like C-terminal domain-containing protein n=1 Tax=Micavibrio aeruginosavorus TaxID=349221 RepID=A0A2W5BZ68_9BACT|nr:MAG: hypothetical protein DI626_01965 [Micavibrio aeruginosavorus]